MTGCPVPQIRRVCSGQEERKIPTGHLGHLGHLGQRVGARAAVPEKHEGLVRTGIWEFAGMVTGTRTEP